MANRIFIIITLVLIVALSAYLIMPWLQPKPVMASIVAAPLTVTTTPTDDLSSYTTADALWAHIADERSGLYPQLRADPLQNQRSLSRESLVEQIRNDAKTFVATYPKDSHIWDAKWQSVEMGGLESDLEMDSAPKADELTRELMEIIEAENAPMQMRVKAQAQFIHGAIKQAGQQPVAEAGASYDAVDAKIVDFEKKFGNDAEGIQAIIDLRNDQLSLLEYSGEKARIQAIMQTMLADSHKQVAEMATQILIQDKEIAELQARLPDWSSFVPSPTSSPTNAPTVTGNLLSDARWAKIAAQAKELNLGDPVFAFISSENTRISQLMANAMAFMEQYPDDPHVWDAKMLLARLDKLSLQFDLACAPQPAEISQDYEEVAKAKTAPRALRAEASRLLIEQALEYAASSTTDRDANWAAADANIANFLQEFGDDFSFDGKTPAVVALRHQELMAIKESYDVSRYQAMVQKLTKDAEAKDAPLALRVYMCARVISDDLDLASIATGDSTGAGWDAVDARITAFGAEFGNDSLPWILDLRWHQLAALKVSGDMVRYEALLQKLLVDPQQEVAAMAREFANNDLRQTEEKANSSN